MVVAGPGTVVQRPTNVSWEVETVVPWEEVEEMLHVPEICFAARITVDCSTIMHYRFSPAVQVKMLVISIEQSQTRTTLG